MSDYTIMGGAIVLVVLLLSLLQKRREKSKVKNIAILKDKKIHFWDRINYRAAFLKLQKIPLLKRYLYNLCKILESYFPGDKNSMQKVSVLILLGSSTASVLIFSICVVLSPSIYTMLCSFVVIYIVNKEIIDGVIDNLNGKIIEQLDNFVELLQFNYAQSHMIDESLHDSICGKNKIVEKHAKAILQILNADDMDSALSVYLKNTQNSFLKELTCICVVVSEYGDSVRNGESCMMHNIVKLKSRLGNELNNLRKIRYAFAAQVVLSIFPIFCSIALISWGTSTIPELEPYLNSFYGFTVRALVPVLTLVVYYVIKRLKSCGEVDLNEHTLLNNIAAFPIVHSILVRYYNNNYGKKIKMDKELKRVGSKLTTFTLAVKRFIFAVGGMALVFMIIVGINFSIKYRITHEIVGDSSKSSASPEEVSVEMLMLIRAYTDKYLSADVLGLYKKETGALTAEYNDSVQQWLKDRITTELTTNPVEITYAQALSAVKQYNTEHANTTKLYLAYFGSNDGSIREENDAMYAMAEEQLKTLLETAKKPSGIEISILRENIASDVAANIASYNTARLQWFHIFIVLMSSFITFQIPYIWLTLNRTATQQMMQNEVLQFQALILILSAEKRISVDVILDWMLKFSVVFRSSLHKCVVHFPESEEQAFEQLLEDETFEPFQSLVRNLMMCDNVGIAQAFSSLEVSQNNYIESIRISTEHRINTNSQLAMLLVIFMLGFVIMADTAYPLMASAQNSLTTTMNAMSDE